MVSHLIRKHLKGYILVVDDNDGSDDLIRYLEKNGYLCYHARGPIKVRSVLDEREIEIILWKDEGTHNELQQDLIKELNCFGNIPVIHLFSKKARPLEVTSPNPISDSLPAESYQTNLLSRISQLIESHRSKSLQSGIFKSELAFRNLVIRLHRKITKQSLLKNSSKENEEFHSAGTALNPNERELLTVYRQMAIDRLSILQILGMPLRWMKSQFPGKKLIKKTN